MTEDQLAAEVKQIIGSVIKKDPAKFSLESNLFTDLGVDSLLGVEILASLDKKYHLDIPEDSLEDVETVQDMVNLARRFYKPS